MALRIHLCFVVSPSSALYLGSALVLLDSACGQDFRVCLYSVSSYVLYPNLSLNYILYLDLCLYSISGSVLCLYSIILYLDLYLDLCLDSASCLSYSYSDSVPDVA